MGQCDHLGNQLHSSTKQVNSELTYILKFCNSRWSLVGFPPSTAQLPPTVLGAPIVYKSEIFLTK